MPEQSRSEPQRPASSLAPDPDNVIERLAALADADAGSDEFHRELLRDLVDATAGLGAALWIAESASFRLADQYRLSHQPSPSGGHGIRLCDAVAGGRYTTFREGDLGTDILVILCPWRLDEKDFGVVELRQKADVSAAAQAGQGRFVCVVSELVTAYRRNRRMAAAARREERWLQIDRFAQAVHRPLDLEATAYEVANEGRRLTGCDRLTVLVRRRSRWRAVAVSGSDSVRRRSSVIAHLELLARLVAARDRSVWSGSIHQPPPPELEEPLDDYHEVSSARLVAFLPLSSPALASEGEETRDGEPFAVLVVERFDRVEPEDMQERCDAVCRHSTGALHRSLMNEEMPLRGLSRLLDRSRWMTRFRQQPWTLVLAIAVVGLVLLLGMVPASLRIEATGSLQPRTQRRLFAPVDSVVERLLVSEAGQSVGLGEELIRLRDPQLRFETERALGELETARKQLAGIEAERLRVDRASRSDLREAASRSAEEESLKKQIEGLERQQAVLRSRREKLSVRSPMDGQVLTWDVEQLLQSRPVGRGQILLTVADLQGPWVLELEIPDDQIADISEALESQENPLRVRFILATAPEIRYVGRLEVIAPATDVRGDRGPTVSAIVAPEDQQAMRTLRPGASVVAKIDCGRRSLLYVMSRGLLRAIRARLLF